jgi:hypothetical protein
MKTVRVRIKSESALIMHRDDVSWAEKLKLWQRDPANKSKSVAGDDRSPAWTWIGGLYHDQGRVCIPQDNLMTMLREGGAKVPTGKKGATYKRLTQSGLLIGETSWPIEIDGKTVSMDNIRALIGVEDFGEHEGAVEKLGFSLLVKRARVGNSKHVRVRASFQTWEASGSIIIMDDQITPDTLATILQYGGQFCGLCDWRPSSPKSPGPFGRFSAEVVR